MQLLLNVALAPIYALAAAVLYFALRGAHGQPVPADAVTGAFAPPQAPPRDAVTPRDGRLRESAAAATRRPAAGFSVMS